jgi:predicted AAA+ superfamily ATPase
LGAKVLSQGDLVKSSKSGYEVDFVLSDRTAIEVKAKSNIAAGDLRGLHALAEENQLEQYLVVSLEKTPRMVKNIKILPWQQFLKQLWESAYG